MIPRSTSGKTTFLDVIAFLGRPADPKRALEVVRRTMGVPRSPALFFELAQRVGTDRCIDPSFAKLKGCLREWFS